MTIGEWVQQNGDPSATRSFFGVIPAYPVFMFIGIILVIAISAFQMKRKKIPLREFEIAIVVVVPIGVIGGSIFGKIFIPGEEWYQVFFFWNPGMSLFGALILGTVAGFSIFYIRSKKTQISIWTYCDVIIPNILIGQAIGRWGNLYNHEILGNIVSYDSLSWLPSAIKNKLFYFPSLTGFELPDGWWNYYDQNHALDGTWYWDKATATSGAFQGLTLAQVMNWQIGSDWLTNSLGQKLDPNIYNYGAIQYRAPLFLYESISNLALWCLLTFVVSNIGRWFSKPKPWDLQPKAFPGWYNPFYKSISEDELENIRTQAPIKYKHVEVIDENGKTIQVKMGLMQAWNKAYYWYLPDDTKVREIEQISNDIHATKAQQLSKLDKLNTDYKNKIKKIKQNYKNKLARTNQMLKEKIKKQYLIDIEYEKKQFTNKKQDIYNSIGNWTRFIKGNHIVSMKLEKLHNPNNYLIIRSGLLTGSYILGYMTIRIGLETQRRAEELFIQNSFVADFIVLSIILLIGIAIMIFAQFIAPYRYREVNWLYEKSY